MGEYAKYHDEEVKIGTCEDMYYLRFDQRHSVKPLRGNVDPSSQADVYALRFRFPWPDEDKVEPGAFDTYERAIAAHGVKSPEGVEHSPVQFVAHAGYLTSLPCPEGSTGVAGVTIHRNGFPGAVQLVQQKFLRDGRLVPVCRCGGCGTAWRVEEPADIEALAVAFRAEGDSRIRQSRDRDPREGAFWHAIADRILSGADTTESPEITGAWQCPRCPNKKYFVGIDAHGYGGPEACENEGDCPNCPDKNTLESYCGCETVLSQAFCVLDEADAAGEIVYQAFTGGESGAEIGSYTKIVCGKCGVTVWEEEAANV